MTVGLHVTMPLLVLSLAGGLVAWLCAAGEVGIRGVT